MIGHSTKFANAVATSHVMAVRARACPTGQTGADPDGVEIPIVSGDIRYDASAAVLGTVDMTTVADWPRRAGDLLNIYSTELFLERGIQYADGTSELLSQGYFRLETVEQDITLNAPSGALRLSASDRMAGIEDAAFLRPRQFDKGDNFGDVIDGLVHDVYPDAVIEWDDADAQTSNIGRAMTTQQDRWGFINDLVASLGKVWFWDNVGVLRIEDLPDHAEPVTTVSAGEGGVMVSASRQLTRTGVYNAVQAVGEGADTQSPPQATVYDMGRDSPTRWNGPFGHVPRPSPLSLPSITTVAQAGAAARTELRKVSGVPYSVDFSAVPNPALRVRDPVELSYGITTAPQTHVLDTLNVPLTYDGDFSAQTRELTHMRIVTDA